MAKAKKETEKKEVKKTTKAAKPAKQAKTEKKPKEIETVDSIIDDVEEDEVEDKVEFKPVKTLKELKSEFRAKKHEIEVEIVNLNSCRTSCRDRHGRLLFALDRTGDREFISLADMVDIANRHKDFFKRHLIAIIDVDSDEYELEDVLTYLNLNEIYEENEIENYDTDYIVQILKMDTKKFKRLIEDANLELVRIVAARALDLYREGRFDSRLKEKALCDRLGKEELFEI